MIKILFVGNDDYEMYSKAFYEAALKKQSLVPDILCWNRFLEDGNCKLFNRIENKTSIGFHVLAFNKQLIKRCQAIKYDIVFLYTCRMIYSSTIRNLRKSGAYVVCYNNDNPFSSFYPSYFWRWYRRNIKHCDMVYSYRKSNIADCERMGGKRNRLLRSYYIKERNYYIPPEELTETVVPEVVFMGHYEIDERIEYIHALSNAGISVGVPRAAWEKHEKNNPHLVMIENAHENYNQIINKSKIALNFLSTLNEDTYTRRCFEIPATKTLLLSIYTDDLNSLFKENEEAVYFRTPEELVRKVIYYLENDREREKIAENGYKRLLASGHEAADRIDEVIDDYLTYCNESM